MLQATELFHDRHPDCDVQIRESQIAEILRWVLAGVVDLALTDYPADAPGLAAGGVLVSEPACSVVPIRPQLASPRYIELYFPHSGCRGGLKPPHH